MLHNKLLQTYQFQTIPIYYLTVSMGQESKHSLLGVSAHGLTDCSQGVSWGWGLIWGSVNSLKLTWSLEGLISCDYRTESTQFLDISHHSLPWFTPQFLLLKNIVAKKLWLVLFLIAVSFFNRLTDYVWATHGNNSC